MPELGQYWSYVCSIDIVPTWLWRIMACLQERIMACLQERGWLKGVGLHMLGILLSIKWDMIKLR